MICHPRSIPSSAGTKIIYVRFWYTCEIFVGIGMKLAREHGTRHHANAINILSLLVFHLSTEHSLPRTPPSPPVAPTFFSIRNFWGVIVLRGMTP